MNQLFKLLNKNERSASWLARKLGRSDYYLHTLSKMTDEDLSKHISIAEVYEIDRHLPGFLTLIQNTIED